MPFTVGQRVAHKTFGHGTVLRSQSSGASEKVTVVFEGSGERAVLASFLTAVTDETASIVERDGDGTLLLYRHKRAAPIGHSVRRFADRSVLALFRRLFAETRRAFEEGGEAAAVRKLGESLGASVYGLSSVFTAACKRPFSLPEDDNELHRVLLRDLYVECSSNERPNFIRFANGALRVRTDDDEVDLAYALVSEALVQAQPGRWDWWAFGGERLPDGEGTGLWQPRFDASFRPLSGVRAQQTASAGRTWAVLLTSYDSDSFGFPGTFVIDGARLPQLGRALREARPTYGHGDEGWPYELRLLRAMVAADESGLESALRRCAEFPVHTLGGRLEPRGDDADPDVAFEAYIAAVAGSVSVGANATSGREFSRSIAAEKRAEKGDLALLDAGDHRAMLCTSGAHRYFDQWVFFDDLWASANPSLADGLLVFASAWDPQRVDAS